jgi:hypothetical protein
VIRKSLKYFICILTVLIFIFFTSCSKGGDDNSGSNPTNPSTDTTAIDPTKIFSFTTSGSPVNNSVYMEQTTIDNDKIILAIKIKGGADVYGSVMEITYDSSKIKHELSAQGDYLGGVGDILFYPFLVNGQEGRLHIAIDKKGTVSGSNGNGILAIVTLKALKVQVNTPISFDTTISNLMPSNSNTPISGTSWLGGTLSYQ